MQLVPAFGVCACASSSSLFLLNNLFKTFHRQNKQQGSTLKHDGAKVVVFTRPELRALDGPLPGEPGAEEAPDADGVPDEGGADGGGDSGAARGRRRRHAAGGSALAAAQGSKPKAPPRGGGSKRGGGKGGERATFRDLQQRTLDEYLGRM